MPRPMHGRIVALSALLLTMALTAAPAQADQTLAPGQPAAADGVVTSWQVQSPATQTARLRTLQPLAGGTATTATSESVTLAGGSAPQAFTARLPVAAGGQITLLDASGTGQPQATVEPDADGDGYGDTTQDACLGDFAAHTAPCGGTQTIGSPLTLAPDPRGFSGAPTPMQALQQSAPGTTSATTAPGILTRWRVRADPAAGDTVLQVLRPSGGSTFVVVAESSPVHVTTTDVVTVAAQVPVQAGDRLAARSVLGGLGSVAHRDGDVLATRQPPKVKGDPAWSTTATAPDLRLLVQADVEPDADADGKGDVSQDRADLVVTVGDGMGGAGAPTYTVANAGPDAALKVTVRLRGGTGDVATPAGSTCVRDATTDVPGGGASTCTVARLDKGAAIQLRLPGFAQTVDAGGVHLRSAATATALTPDPDTTNNVASLGSDQAPYIPNLPPQAPFNAPACGHVVKGTRDDDVVRGTVFGDRLVGSDGGDLLKGGGGDDCLEGGSGNDVLDGGDGDDRLAGASGRDRLAGGTGGDKLTGGQGNDRLSGGPGNDTLAPGDGRDSIDAGAGNDTINAVDGVRETVECGAGRDTVRADRRDRLKHCEKVTRRR
jgi:Ca2+-binding RTX toxin-like protein